MSTVAAISTGRAPGGIGVVRISGENAISIADKVVVLTKRPATVKKIDKIDFQMENRNPMNCRKSPKFSKYFDSLWKELDVDAKEK